LSKHLGGRYSDLVRREAETHSIAALALHADENGCWLWRGNVNGRGRPVLALNGQGALAHRVGYRLWREAGHELRGPLRPNVPLLQTCGNRSCVNPFHMEPVDPRNGSTIQDPRGLPNRSKNRCPKGHPYSGFNLIVRPCGRRRCRACHRESLRRYQRRRREQDLRTRILESQPKDWLAEFSVEPVGHDELPVAVPVRIA